MSILLATAAAARLGDPVEIPDYLTGLLDGQGEVDARRVRARLDELRRTVQSPP